MSKTASVVSLFTDKSLSSNHDVNKAHGDDMVSIPMLKLWDESICKPFHFIFKSFCTQGMFQSEWKKANVAPIHK